MDFLPCLIPQDEGSYNSSGIENSLINASTLSNADRYIYVVLATGNDCMKLKVCKSNHKLCLIFFYVGYLFLMLSQLMG